MRLHPNTTIKIIQKGGFNRHDGIKSQGESRCQKSCGSMLRSCTDKAGADARYEADKAKARCENNGYSDKTCKARWHTTFNWKFDPAFRKCNSNFHRCYSECK